MYSNNKKIIYIYIKVQLAKESNRGETEFSYKSCSPKIKDKTIKNRIFNMSLYNI